MGLCKKIIIADAFARIANLGFNHAEALGFIEAWIIVLSYSFQLYFDFSGYTDMAIGSSLLFNIQLPFNFNSPYKALDIQDFWRRWHITLSRFLRDYVYIPLGGNRLSELRILTNLVMTFIIGGLWHGAGWTFIFWGFVHGIALVIHRLWKKTGVELPRACAWGVTFFFVITAWVFFRAESFSRASNIIRSMFGMNTIALPVSLKKFACLHLPHISFGGVFEVTQVGGTYLLLLLTTLVFVVISPNSNEFYRRIKPNFIHASILLLLAGYLLINLNKVSEFIYFNF